MQIMWWKWGKFLYQICANKNNDLQIRPVSQKRISPDHCVLKQGVMAKWWKIMWWRLGSGCMGVCGGCSNGPQIVIIAILALKVPVFCPKNLHHIAVFTIYVIVIYILYVVEDMVDYVGDLNNSAYQLLPKCLFLLNGMWVNWHKYLEK